MTASETIEEECHDALGSGFRAVSGSLDPVSFVTRFAPSPTGHLRWATPSRVDRIQLPAQAADGRFLLRIEDIDQGRSRPEEFEATIFEKILAWPAFLGAGRGPNICPRTRARCKPD